MPSLKKMVNLESMLISTPWCLLVLSGYCRCYNTTLRAIIPLPDPEASPSSPAHLDAYPEFPKGSTVMALYPDTSCFYRAQVLASPTDLQPSGRVCFDS
jgi:hypothetical protein